MCPVWMARLWASAAFCRAYTGVRQVSERRERADEWESVFVSISGGRLSLVRGIINLNLTRSSNAARPAPHTAAAFKGRHSAAADFSH